MGPQTNRLYHVWQQHHVPPWEVLGTRWTTRSKRAWYLAAVTVTLEDQQTLAQRRETERLKLQAQQANQGSRLPSGRRLR